MPMDIQEWFATVVEEHLDMLDDDEKTQWFSEHLQNTKTLADWGEECITDCISHPILLQSVLQSVNWTEIYDWCEETYSLPDNCCLCYKRCEDKVGNNAQPVMAGICCDKCNISVVIPMRIKREKQQRIEYAKI